MLESVWRAEKRESLSGRALWAVSWAALPWASPCGKYACFFIGIKRRTRDSHLVRIFVLPRCEMRFLLPPWCDVTGRRESARERLS